MGYLQVKSSKWNSNCWEWDHVDSRNVKLDANDKVIVTLSGNALYQTESNKTEKPRSWACVT